MEYPQIIVANKMDMPERENLEEFKKKLLLTMMNLKNYRQSSNLRFDQTRFSTFGRQRLNFLISIPEFLLYDESEMKKKFIMALMKKKPSEISRDDDATWVLMKTHETLTWLTFDRDESQKFARQSRWSWWSRARGAKDGDWPVSVSLRFE